MINKNRTVLILGAGASQPFSFPTGDQLKDEIVKCMRSSDFIRQVMNELNLSPFSEDPLAQYRDEISQARTTSIDKFIARLPHENQRKIAKMAIARILLTQEDSKALDQVENNWYLELYRILDRDANLTKFGDNKLSIITFNYERSLEQYLYSRLEGDYGPEKRGEIAAQLRKIPIIHVNGCLGYLPWQNPERHVGYGQKHYRLSSIAADLKIIGEPTNDQSNPVIAKAQNLISQADKIYFLGFGYDKRNLDILNLELINKCKGIFGTCFGVTTHLQDSISLYFNNRITFSPGHHKSYEFIQHFAPDRTLPQKMSIMQRQEEPATSHEEQRL